MEYGPFFLGVENERRGGAQGPRTAIPRGKNRELSQRRQALARTDEIDALNRLDHVRMEVTQLGAGHECAERGFVLGARFKHLGEDDAGFFDDPWRNLAHLGVEKRFERATQQRGGFDLVGRHDVGGASDRADEHRAGEGGRATRDARAAKPFEDEAGAETDPEEHGALAVQRVDFFNEVVELRAQEIERETRAWIIQVINRTML